MFFLGLTDVRLFISNYIDKSFDSAGFYFHVFLSQLNFDYCFSFKLLIVLIKSNRGGGGIENNQKHFF